MSSIATPTTRETAEDVVAQMELALGQTVPFLPKAFVRVLAKVVAAAHVLLFKYCGWIFLQMFVAYASIEETTINGRRVSPLKEWGRLVGEGDPFPATRAELVINVSVLVQTGDIPASSQVIYAPTGVLYLTTHAVALDAATVQVTMIASSDQDGGGGEGAIGNLEAGDIVSFANPLPNILKDATVVSQAATGADGETTDAYRARIIRRIQRKPQGGAYADYQLWGEDGAGVLNVYPYRGAPGEVDVYVEATEASSGSPDGIPTGAQLLAVAAVIEQDESGLANRRPVNAAVNVLAITRTGFDFAITGLDAPDLPLAYDTISKALNEYLRSRQPFVEGLSVLPREDRITQAACSGIAEDAVSAVGGTFTTFSMQISGIPYTAYTLTDGEKAKLGTLTT